MVPATVAAPAMVIAFYVWTSASAGSPFEFSGNHGGYYDLLTHGFLSGHVYLKLEPPPELLALPNPFDPVANARYRVNDLSLYRGKYYLYFGPVPVLTLCLPWHALTGNTLPEDFAALIFVTAGYIFSLLLLDILLKAAGVRPPPILKAAAAVALGMGQYGAVVVRDPGVYGVAVAAGFCFFMAGMFCFARWFSSDRPNGWLGALAGLLIGLTPGCRPHYALAALALCLLSLASMKAPRRQAIWFILPVALCGLLVLWYNSARFGNPLEFGTTYQLTAVAATRGVSLRLGNLPRGLYYLLLFPPGLGEQFPFLAPRYVGPTPGFYVENQVGLLALCPLAIAGLTLPRLRQPIISRPMDLRRCVACVYLAHGVCRRALPAGFRSRAPGHLDGCMALGSHPVRAGLDAARRGDRARLRSSLERHVSSRPQPRLQRFYAPSQAASLSNPGAGFGYARRAHSLAGRWIIYDWGRAISAVARNGSRRVVAHGTARRAGLPVH